jgi:hypothetical protein
MNSPKRRIGSNRSIISKRSMLSKNSGNSPKSKFRSGKNLNTPKSSKFSHTIKLKKQSDFDFALEELDNIGKGDSPVNPTIEEENSFETIRTKRSNESKMSKRESRRSRRQSKNLRKSMIKQLALNLESANDENSRSQSRSKYHKLSRFAKYSSNELLGSS